MLARRLPVWLVERFAALDGPPPAGSASGERDQLGPWGERAAARHLRRLGYRVLGRNLRVPMGEADLLCVAPDRETVVLVEVKSRRINASGLHQPPPEASVHAQKRSKLISILRHLAAANGWHDRPLRIDAVAVEVCGERVEEIRHHQGVVRP